MRTFSKLVFLLTLMSSSAQSRDLLNPETHELSNYGLAAMMVASAQVAEMNCGLKNQIPAALNRLHKAGFQFDLQDREDFSAVLFLATEVLSEAKKTGVEEWCKKYRTALRKFYGE